jgi:hypothetical protein
MKTFIPTPSSSSLELGFFTFHYYALCILLGIFVAIWVTKKRYFALGGNPNDISELAIYAIHYNQTIAGLNLLDGINFVDEKNKISFESKIICISKNDLNAQKILQFYDLLIAENFAKAEEIFKDEYQIFMQGAKEYLEFHGKLGNDSIIKPANYFGGTGVVVAQNQILNLNQAIKNITKSFLAVWQDCNNSGHLDLAFLPTIIVQERATLAHLGDLRIVFCGNNFQGIFVRVNPNFAKSNANNLHFGGHPESLFKRYRINKEGVDLMIDDMKKSGLDEKSAEIKKSKALYGLLQNLDFFQQIKILSEYLVSLKNYIARFFSVKSITVPPWRLNSRQDSTVKSPR